MSLVKLCFKYKSTRDALCAHGLRRLTTSVYCENTGGGSLDRKGTGEARCIRRKRKHMLRLSKRPKAKRKINTHNQEAKLGELKWPFSKEEEGEGWGLKEVKRHFTMKKLSHRG